MQMSRPSMSQLLRAGEVTYAIVTLFALTQGPVYRLWSESSTYLETSPQPSMPHVYFATFVVVQLPAVMLLSRRVPGSWLHDRRIQALSALLIWLALSVTWSTLARHSLPEYVSLLLTSSVGLYLAVSFTSRTIWRIVATSMSLGLVSSVWAVVREWELSTSAEEGYWIGIYLNRNSLAPVAAVALLASVGMTLTQTSWKTLASRVVLVAAVSLTALSGVVLWQAESRTSPLALGVAVGSFGGWLLVRWIFSKALRQLQQAALPVFTATVAIVSFFSLRLVGGSTTVSGETATFNSRGALWSLSWTGFLEKPFHGWGWMSAWHTPQFFKQGTWWAVFDTTWSHNGYHDLLLGGGVLSGLLFVAVVWFGVQAIGSEKSLRKAIPNFLIIAFVLAAATQESFFIGTHFLWALLIVGLFVPRHMDVKSRGELVE
jgi:exopolysaccharide production protein ExoQ